MADIPYSAEIKSNKISKDLATRLYEFKQIYGIITAMSVLNGSKANNESLLELGDKIANLYENYSELTEVERKTLDDNFERYPEMYDIADKFSENGNVAEKLATMRGFAAQRGAELSMRRIGFDKIAGGECMNVTPSLQGTLFAILEKENRKVDCDSLAERIIHGGLKDDEINMAVSALQTAAGKVMQQMKSDWQTYEDMKTPNPNIEAFRGEFEELLLDSMNFEYKTYPETRHVLLCIRDDFNDKEAGSKQSFLKIMGALMDCGQSDSLSAQAAQIRKNNCYTSFINEMKKAYPENTEQVIDVMLDTAKIKKGQDAESIRREAFEKKGQEMYFKFLAAVLAEKRQANEENGTRNFNYAQYIKKNVADYISDMRNGANNSAKHLGLVEGESYRDIIDDTAENQFVSVHHIIPVASAVPMYVEMHPEIHDTAQTAKFVAELKDKCPEVFEGGRSEKDMLTIGLALSVFPEEISKEKLDNPANMTDFRRKKYHQAIKNKENIRKVYKKYFPHSADTLTDAKKEILEYIDNIGNHALPIGKEVHQKCEPNGNILLAKVKNAINLLVKNDNKFSGKSTVEKVNNNMALATEYTYPAKGMGAILMTLPPTIQKGLAQYLPLDRGETISVSSRVALNRPETSFIKWVREKLNSGESKSPIQLIRNGMGLQK